MILKLLARCNSITYIDVIGNQRAITTTSSLNAGHSKWANIRHTKALKDGQKAANFARITRQLRLAIQEGGSNNPALNSPLRSLIDEALRKNMPMATIQNTLKKFDQNKIQIKKHIQVIRFKQKVYAILLMYTENVAGLKMSLSTTLRKSGAAFDDSLHLFEDYGIIETTANEELLKKCTSSDDALENLATNDAIECGAEDVEVVDRQKGIVNFICNPIEMTGVRRAIENKGYTIESAEHVFNPKNCVLLTDEEFQAYEKFIQKLKDIPEIEDVYDNVQPM